MAKPHRPSDLSAQRSLRVGELIRHALSDLLSRGEVNDPVLEGHVISVSEVRMSPDLKHATVFVMPLGGKDTSTVLDSLERNRKFMRGEVAHRVALKFAPDLRFRLDESFEQGAKIDAILNSPSVQRDLSVLGDDNSETQ